MYICIVSDEVVNTPPFLLNPVDNITVTFGQYFEYKIPSDTFYDLQDGTTEKVTLGLVNTDQSELTEDSWVQFDADRQVIFGLPLEVGDIDPMNEFVLVAKDSSGLMSERDAIVIKVNTTATNGLNHFFDITIDLNYESFMKSTENVINLVLTIGNLFGEATAQSVVLSNITNGSVVMRWSNGTLSKKICENDTINAIFDKLSGGGVLNADFRAALLPKYNVTSVSLELAANCVPTLPVVIMPPMAPSHPATGGEQNVLLWTVIPAIITVLLILIIAIILCCVRRKKRYSGKVMLDDERPIFTNNRKPVLLENELQMRDLNNVPKHPVVLNRELDSDVNVDTVRPSPLGDADRPKPPPYYYPDDFDPMLDNLESPPPSYRGSPSEGNSPLYGKHPPEYKLPPPYSAHINPVFPRRGSSDV